MHIRNLFASLLLGASLAGAVAYATPVPETEAVVERYDAERQVLVIAGREFRLSGDVANQLMRFVTVHGADALAGKRIAYSASRSGSGQPVIEAIAY